MLNLVVLARRAVGLLQSSHDAPNEDRPLEADNLEMADDVKTALTKVKLRTRDDHITAATFILQSLLAQELPRSLMLQLKKHLRRLESAVVNADPLEANEANSEVMYMLLNWYLWLIIADVEIQTCGVGPDIFFRTPSAKTGRLLRLSR